MCARTSANEKRILTFSALLASAFAVGGLVVGVLVGSLVIIFDGAYSLVSLVLTLLSLAVSNYIQRPDSNIFPFGKAVLEPVVIAIKGCTILAVVITSLISAISAMFHGGREVDASIAMLVGVLNVAGCAYAWWYIAGKSLRFSSGLIDAEVKQWKMDTLLSLAVLLGFGLAWLVAQSDFAHYGNYADPLMMILMSFYFIKVPLRMLLGALRELLMMTPSEEICRTVDLEISELDKLTVPHIQLAGVTKVGRELRVNIDIHAKDNQLQIAEIEKTRRTLARKLSKLSLDLNLTMNIASY
ncbi:cation diffusion facilitator family transporter [Vibrio sp.]|uniref:cation diffusion facilitator family transporter n=1 Tax=Vibrio sp. TaxID=678 RepID=UPI003D14BFFA